jgi:hypothetical protein
MRIHGRKNDEVGRKWRKIKNRQFHNYHSSVAFVTVIGIRRPDRQEM